MTLRVGLSNYIVAILGVILFSVADILIIIGYRQGSVPLINLIVIGGLVSFSIIFLIYSMLTQPYKYCLNKEGLSECGVVKTIFYPAKSIRSVQYGQIRAKYHTRWRHFRMVNYITFNFTNNSCVTIDDRYISDPIELVVQYVENNYGIKPTYYDIEKQ